MIHAGPWSGARALRSSAPSCPTSRQPMRWCGRTLGGRRPHSTMAGATRVALGGSDRSNAPTVALALHRLRTILDLCASGLRVIEIGLDPGATAHAGQQPAHGCGVPATTRQVMRCRCRMHSAARQSTRPVSAVYAVTPGSARDAPPTRIADPGHCRARANRAITREGAPNARPRTGWSWAVGLAGMCR